jgi:PAS domain S-box-containing protein
MIRFPLNHYLYLIEDYHQMQQADSTKESGLKTENENLYKMLIEAAEDRIGLFTHEGKPVIVNAAFASALGYTREEYFSLSEMELVHPDDREKLLSVQDIFLEKGYVELEYRMRHKDGRELHMSSKSVLLRSSDLQNNYVLYIMRDITDKKKVEEELRAAKERAEESDRLKSSFLANMSHEIRTPMNSIVGFANLLSEADPDENSRGVYVDRINKNSEQLLALISDIIDLSKIESNQLSIAPANVILDALFRDLAVYARDLLSRQDNKRIEIRYEPDPNHSGQQVYCDRVRLLQVLQNLVNNALKFTSSGTISLGYELRENAVVRMFVSDTGIGIDQAYYELIFKHFRQIDDSNTRTFGGAGLGLAISRQLTELMGGRIWVESEKNKGSTFFVEMPVGQHEQNFDLMRSEKGDEKDENTARSILMVDDDQDSLALLTTLLKKKGFHIRTAGSGYRALQLLENPPLPDLVLLDLEMPTLNGYHTQRIIKDLYPELPVIAQSAHALEGDRQKCLAMGFDGYFSKPYNVGFILREIASVMKN